MYVRVALSERKLLLSKLHQMPQSHRLNPMRISNPFIWVRLMERPRPVPQPGSKLETVALIRRGSEPPQLRANFLKSFRLRGQAGRVFQRLKVETEQIPVSICVLVRRGVHVMKELLFSTALILFIPMMKLVRLGQRLSIMLL